jgi:hypothetical protein
VDGVFVAFEDLIFLFFSHQLNKVIVFTRLTSSASSRA